MHADLTQTCCARMAQRQNFGKDSGRFQKSNYSQLYEFCPRGAANLWVSPHFRFIKDDFIPGGVGQAAFRFCIPSWPCSLGDRGAEARKRAEWAWCSWSTGDHKCDAGMSVENVPAVVNIKTLKGHWRDDLLHTSSLLGGRWGWWRVWKRRRVLLASLQLLSWLDQFSRLKFAKSRLRLRFLTGWLSSIIRAYTHFSSCHTNPYICRSFLIIKCIQNLPNTHGHTDKNTLWQQTFNVKLEVLSISESPLMVCMLRARHPSWLTLVCFFFNNTPFVIVALMRCAWASSQLQCRERYQ